MTSTIMLVISVIGLIVLLRLLVLHRYEALAKPVGAPRRGMSILVAAMFLGSIPAYLWLGIWGAFGCLIAIMAAQLVAIWWTAWHPVEGQARPPLRKLIGDSTTPVALIILYVSYLIRGDPNLHRLLLLVAILCAASPLILNRRKTEENKSSPQ